MGVHLFPEATVFTATTVVQSSLSLIGRWLLAIFQCCGRVVLTVWEGSWGNGTRGFCDRRNAEKPFVSSYAGKKWTFFFVLAGSLVHVVPPNP